MPRAINTLGFSLVELSIVLVILGLLVGGVLSGQSLIRAAELRAVVSEFDRYRTASLAFRDKYFALPGDMANATQIWGHTGGAGCTNSSGTGLTSPGTCDGDGDGILRHGTAANRSAEAFQAWRQLALAGLIEGSYSGIAGVLYSGIFAAVGGGAVDYDFGVNSPKSRVNNAGWGLTYLDNTSGSALTALSNNYFNWMTVGSSDNMFAEGEFLSPSEAWNIDTKLDDGVPNRGNVHSWVACTVANAYPLTSSAQLCGLIFKGY